MKFTEMLEARWRNQNTLLCVGLDPNRSRFPEELADSPNAIYDFCCGIVDATADLVCAFKPQIAYFASEGAEDALKRIIEYIHANHPGIPVILDAKRGDIGSTCEHYAREAFERFKADCVTLSPYMGEDTITPYLKYEDKGIFLLCRTSNKSGDELQMLDVGGERLFERVARLRAATFRPPSRPAWIPAEPAWSLIPAAPFSTQARAPTGRTPRERRPKPPATPSMRPAAPDRCA